MGQYRLLFTISIRHDFFAGGRCRDLHFTPSSTTAGIIGATGLIVRDTGNGLDFFYDESKRESIEMYLDDPVDPLRFFFTVRSRDPRFFNYTTPDISRDDQILYFQAGKPDKADKSSFRLTRGGSASKRDFEKTDDPGMKDMLTFRDLHVKPHFIISIAPDPKNNLIFNEHGEVVENHFHIRFRARKTYWKYIVIDNHETGNVYLSDIKKKISFVQTNSPSLPGKKEVLSYISREPIPLCETPSQCFQLKTRKSGRGKTLIKKIPVASADAIFKGSTDDRSCYLSEIFINL